METWEWVAIAVGAAVVLLVLIGLMAWMRSRRRPDGAGKRLKGIEEEHDRLTIRDLPEAARERYLEEWRQAESRFVSDPHEAARSAERLVERALEERGYPSDTSPERRAALVGVDDPYVAQRYRHGSSLMSHTDGDGDSTERLREAMVDYRTVLEVVIGERQAA